MGNRMDVILKEFGQTLGCDELTFDEHGYCCLFFDDIVVNLEVNEKTEQLFLYSNIGDIPKDVNTELYEKLLEGNFLFQGTSGGTIGMDKTAGIFSLAWQGPFIEMGAAAFEMILENFVNLTEHWRGIVKDLSSSPGSGDSLPGFPQGIRV